MLFCNIGINPIQRSSWNFFSQTSFFCFLSIFVYSFNLSNNYKKKMSCSDIKA